MFSRLFLYAVVFFTFGFFSNAQAATFTVTLGGDSNNGSCGQFCTLRDAITAANANGSGADTINFNLNPSVAIIQPLAPLPIIKSSLTIDGTTQTGYFGAPEIILDGSGAGASASGLQIESPVSAATLNVTIRGLAINRFGLHGIFSNCTNACNLTVQGNRIGTNSSGLIDMGNGLDGINIVETGGSSYTIGGAGTFEGNVISGNERMGIRIQPISSSVPTGTGTATIIGNLIGVNSAGTAALGNSGRGIDVTNFAGGTNNIYQLTLVVGGTTAAHRNIISGNGADGIAYIAHDVSILGNYIGTNQAGAAALANDGDGIEAGKSFHAIIGGLTLASRNVISGNDDSGIALKGSAEIYNNYIGTTASGSGTVGNGGNGIFIDSTTGATIGGSFSIAGATLDVGNVISGNGVCGIAIFSAAPTEPYLIKRNRIGTNAAGTAAIPNQQDGIFMGYPNTDSTVPHVIGSDTNAGDGNVISGNVGDGIEIGATYRLVKIFGNRIGTNLAATAVIHNQGNGLVIRSELNQVGQTGNDTAANVISGNAYNGVSIVGAEAKYNKIYHNFIGTNAAGANLGNIRDGVYINQSAKYNRVGDGEAGGSNVIAFNNDRGVTVADGLHNQIRHNSIYSNAELGIDLNGNGVSLNDVQDADSGPNNLQNFPVISQASPAQILGSLNTQALMRLTIDIYRVDSCDASGHGEGRYHVGNFDGEADLGGNLSFNITGFNLTAGQIIVMTATDDYNNTSEFSQCKTVTPAPGNVSFTNANYTANEAGNSITIGVTRGGGSFGAISVNYATSNGTATAGQDYTAKSGTLNFNNGEVFKSFDIPINNDLIDEINETVNLTLSNPTGGAFIVNNATAILTITDNDAPPTVSITDVLTEEGNVGTNQFSFRIQLSGASSFPISVDYLTADVTATFNSDYLPTNGTVNFAPGETLKNILVTVNGDLVTELDETFVVNLSNPANATFGDNQATGTIVDDDNPGKFLFALAPYSGTEHDSVLVTVSRTNGDAGTVSVDYATTGGTAQPLTDYTPVSGTLVFGNGETTKTFNVSLADDSIAEPTESVNLVLSNPIGGAMLGVPATAVLNIFDNDNGTLLNIGGEVKKADNTPIANVTMTLQGATNATATTDNLGRYSFPNLVPTGSYSVTPSAIGFTFNPINRQYNNLSADVLNANFTATAAPVRQLRIVGGNATPTQNITATVELVAQGDENSIGFSLNFDHAILTNPQVTLAADALAGNLFVNDSQAASGKLGILLAMPSGQSFAAGTKSLVTITFNTLPTTTYNSPVTFGNTPIGKLVVNSNANPLPTNYMDGAVTFAQGWEADVTPRPTGKNNGTLTVTDFTQIGRFVAGLDQTNALYNEFQRADCAPRISLGNGALDVADFTQAGRYVAAIDPTTPTGGNFAPRLFEFGGKGKLSVESPAKLNGKLNWFADKPDFAPTVVRVVNTSATAGQQVFVSIVTDATGTENGFGFTLNYDAAKLSNPLVMKGADTQTATLIPNLQQTGKAGVVLAMPFGESIGGGARHVVTIRFNVAANAAGGLTVLSFSDAPVIQSVSDIDANTLQSIFQNGAINVVGPTAATVSVGGRVTAANGKPIGQARILMTDASGATRIAITNPFGYYRFTDVAAGATYVFNVSHKLYQFTDASRILTIFEDAQDINFTGED